MCSQFSIYSNIFFFLQFHIRILETSQENIAALLVGLEYLIDISYVDDTEVFKVWVIVRIELVGQT